MSKRGRRGASCSTTRGALLASVVISAMLVPVAVAPSVSAQPVESNNVFAQIESLSREASAVSEEYIRIDEDVKAKEAELAGLETRVTQATERAESLRSSADELKGDVGTYALQRMRGQTLDPMTAVLGSDDAQSAIDRSAYVNQLARDKENKLAAISQAQRAAADEYAAASSARTIAQSELKGLEVKRGELDKRADELEASIDEVTVLVNALTPEERIVWENKNNPVTVGLETFTGSSAAVDAAMTRIGAPYVWGATGPDSFDCSGLMQWAYAQIGKSIPRTSQQQLAGGTPVAFEDLQPGDLIGFYPGITHVGMYVGDGKIIHAADYGIPVQVVPMSQGGPYQGAVRF
ncbi:C40 family peptidase [Corynebacterium sp. H113]|uniref:C40 family peptidase n=1 Tax=Corynebacterium sp. H113 TaxID=3133419 RepID=UPI0030AA321B